MPYIDAKISKKLSSDEMSALKAEFGKAISVFPGKSETWLMCGIESGQNLWFQGSCDAPAAFLEVKLFGTVDAGSAERFTKQICGVLEQRFGISSDRVYIRYEGGTSWGWNGGNF